MELRWWAVAIAGLVLLATCIALAVLLPMPQQHRRLRPLANVDRLTRLPEYVRVVRLQMWGLLVALVLLSTVFVAAILAGSRPMGTGSTSADAVQGEDVMLCVGQPVTDPATADFLNYFARQANTFDTERIGMTSTTLRVIPITRDYQYAVEQLGRYASLAALDAQANSGEPMSAAQRAELRTGREEFSRSPDYSDYARSVEDVLALCMTGFPRFDNESPHPRSVIYLGPGEIRAADEQRASLFTAEQVDEMAAEAGVQINAISRPGATGNLRSITAGTGGEFTGYDPAALTSTLDKIDTNPPQPSQTTATTVAGRSLDSPNVALVCAVAIATLLCGALVVVRR